MRKQTVLIFVAIFALSGLADGQSPKPNGDAVNWINGMNPTDDEAKLIDRIIEFISANWSSMPDLHCPKKDGANNTKMASGANNGGTRHYPVTQRDGKKWRLGVYKGFTAPPGTPPGPAAGPSIGQGNPAGSAKVPKNVTWQKLLKCLGKIRNLVVADNNSTPGTPEAGVMATGRRGAAGKGTITVSRAALAAAANGASADPANPIDPAATEAFVNLAALLMHEVVHTKQEVKGGGGFTPAGGVTGGGGHPGEAGGYQAQLMTLCWLEFWLTNFSAGNEEDPNQVAALTNLAKGMGVATAGMTPSQIAAALLNQAQFSTFLTRAKSFAKTKRDEYVAKNEGPIGGGPGVIRVSLGANEVGTIDRDAMPPRLSYVFSDTQVNIPLDSVSWATAWTLDPMTILIAGIDGIGGERLLEYTDTDGDDAPDTLTSTSGLVGVDGDHAFVHATPLPVDIWILDRDAPAIRRLHDADGNGVPETIGPVFADYAGLGIATRIIGAGVTSSGFEVAVALPDDPAATSLQFAKAIRLVDIDGDFVAEIQSSGYAADLWPPPAAAEPLVDLDDLEAGSTSLLVYGDGTTDDVLVLRNLSLAGAQIGVGAVGPPDLGVVVPLSSPLAATQFISLESASGAASVYLVPLEPWHPIHNPVTLPADPAEFEAATWDVNDDGIRDHVIAEEDPDRLYVGLRDIAGQVLASHVVVLPVEVNGILDTGDPTTLRFTGADEGVDIADPQYSFVRHAGAPGAGIAQPIGDIDGDGVATDALVVTQSGARSTVWFYLDAPGGGSWGSSPLLAPAMDSVYSFSARDYDGDGDIDLLTTVEYDEIDDRRELFVWDGSEFVHSDFPILAIADSEIISSGPVQASFELEFVIDPVSVGSGGGSGVGGTEDLAYVMLLTDTGMEPGISVDDVHIPLNASPLMDVIVLLGNTEYTIDFQQLVPSNGVAHPQLNVPAALVGGPAIIHGGFLVYGVQSGTAYARSNVVQFEVVD